MSETVYVIERMLAPGIWDLASEVYYTNSKMADAEAAEMAAGAKKIGKNMTFRTTALKKFELKPIRPI